MFQNLSPSDSPPDSPDPPADPDTSDSNDTPSSLDTRGEDSGATTSTDTTACDATMTFDFSKSCVDYMMEEQGDRALENALGSATGNRYAGPTIGPRVVDTHLVSEGYSGISYSLGFNPTKALADVTYGELSFLSDNVSGDKVVEVCLAPGVDLTFGWTPAAIVSGNEALSTERFSTLAPQLSGYITGPTLIAGPQGGISITKQGLSTGSSVAVGVAIAGAGAGAKFCGRVNVSKVIEGIRN
jgi:hypothetical protein